MLYNPVDINIEEYFKSREKYVLIDVRSPIEYISDHILGSYNIPLFSDEEREIIGTLYKKEGITKAKKIGRRFIGEKLNDILEEIFSISDREKKDILIYCQRGGDRSKVVANLAAMERKRVNRIYGGYKAYRRHVVDYFDTGEFPKLIVLYGHTGTKKTDIIKELKKRGANSLDLEGLANHRGSVFGHVGLGKQGTQKLFETKLFEILNDNRNKIFFCEGESKKIGRIHLPDKFFEHLKSEDKINIYSSIKYRVEYLLNDYGATLERNNKEILDAVEYLKIFLGNKNIDHLKKMFTSGNYYGFVEYLLINYYDPLYERHRSNDKFIMEASSDIIEECIDKILLLGGKNG